MKQPKNENGVCQSPNLNTHHLNNNNNRKENPIMLDTHYNSNLLSKSSTNDTITMSSREIAELTGKQHKDVMRDIRNMLDDLNGRKIAPVEYLDKKGEKRPEYQLPKRETLILVSGYSVELRARIIDRWQELEEATKNTRPLKSDQKVQAMLARESRLAANTFKSLFKEGGFKGAELLHAVSNATRTLTGFDAMEAANIKYIETERTQSLLLPSEIGKKIGINARYVNLLLTDHGYQLREPKKKGGYRYLPTEKGISVGATLCRVERSNKSAMEDELRWPENVADILKALFVEAAE